VPLLQRNLTDRVLEALSDTPVVLLHGARQTGKSTLVQQIARSERPATYFTFDDATTMAAAARDPLGFLDAQGGSVVLDEVQRVPDVLLAIKTLVDRERIPGRFLLTGSANVLLLPKISESLAGRMEVLALWPFSQGEIESRRDAFVDAVFAPRMPATPSDEPANRRDLVQRVLLGGYPEVLQRKARPRRSAWFEAYGTTVIHRELRDLANLEYLTELPQLLRLLASRVGAQLNYAELAGTVGIPQTTLKRYLTLLRAVHLFVPLPAWSSSRAKRLVKRPKILLADSGLIAHLIDLDEKQIEKDATAYGHLLECFVAMELRKQITWSRIRPSMYHFRTHSNAEVDLVLESPSGDIVGIEVKAASRVRSEDLRGLELLKDVAGDRFRRGVVLYTGTDSVSLGDNLHVTPMSALWRTAPD